MEINLKTKELGDFVFYILRQESKWEHQNITLQIIKDYAQNMLAQMKVVSHVTSHGTFETWIPTEDLQDRIRGTFNSIVESIDGLKKMEGIPHEAD